MIRSLPCSKKITSTVQSTKGTSRQNSVHKTRKWVLCTAPKQVGPLLGGTVNTYTSLVHVSVTSATDHTAGIAQDGERHRETGACASTGRGSTSQLMHPNGMDTRALRRHRPLWMTFVAHALPFFLNIDILDHQKAFVCQRRPPGQPFLTSLTGIKSLVDTGCTLALKDVTGLPVLALIRCLVSFFAGSMQSTKACRAYL